MEHTSRTPLIGRSTVQKLLFIKESRVQMLCGIHKGGLAVRIPYMVSELNLDKTIDSEFSPESISLHES